MKELHTKEMFIVSFSDCWSAIKRVKLKMACAAFLMAVVFFIYRIQKPLQYTGEAYFYSQNQIAKNDFTATLQAVLSSSSPGSVAEDARTLIHSQQVMQRMIKNLNLQGTLLIKEKNKDSSFLKIKDNLLASWYYFFSPRLKPHSPILDSKVHMSHRDLFKNKKKHLLCEEIVYPRTTYLNLKIHHIKDDYFHVFNDQNRCLGDGYFNTPFKWKDISFVLRRTSERFDGGKHFHLCLIPLDIAAQSLQRNIAIKADKKRPSLLKITFHHTDPNLAVDIANEVMKAYHEYLIARGEKKIESQLAYLERRKNASLKAFETIASTYKDYLQEHIVRGNFLTAEEDVAFLAERQKKAHSALSEIIKEMQKIDASYGTSNDSSSTDDLIAEVRRWQKSESANVKEAAHLNLDILKQRLQLNQNEFDAVELELRNYTACLDKLLEPQFDVVSLTNTIHSEQLESHFKKIDALNYKMHDTVNWTQKERLSFSEELETEKTFLKSHLVNLKEGALIRKSVLTEKMDAMRKIALILLLNAYDETSTEIKNLAMEMDLLPRKWLQEQNLNFEKKLQTDIAESITKAIEAKNLAFHMQNLESMPLQYATKSPLPNHPHLPLSLVLGACVGGGAVVFLTMLITIYRGPSASVENLKAAGFHVVKKTNTLELDSLLVQNMKGSAVVLFSSEKLSSTLYPFLELLQLRKEKVLLITPTTEVGLLNYLEGEIEMPTPLQKKGVAILPWGDSRVATEILLNSRKLQQLLLELKKEYEWIIIEHCAPVDALKTRLLASFADKAVVEIGAEMLSSIDYLPKTSCFIVDTPPQKSEVEEAILFFNKQKKMFHLRKLEPTLRKVMQNKTVQKMRSKLKI